MCICRYSAAAAAEVLVRFLALARATRQLPEREVQCATSGRMPSLSASASASR